MLRSNRQSVWSRGVAEALESRILLSRMVIERVGGILGNTVDNFFIPWGPGDQTINGLNEDGGNDQIFITESDDRKITVNPGTGTDLITVGSGDLDHIGSGTIVINAGTDLFQDEVQIQDNSDVGNDTYNVTESSGLIGIVKPNNSGNQVIRVGQTRVKLTLALNRGDDTVNVDSSVSINNTDQELNIDQSDFETLPFPRTARRSLSTAPSTPAARSVSGRQYPTAPFCTTRSRSTVTRSAGAAAWSLLARRR